MNALAALPDRLRPLVERLDALGVRERGLLFAGGVVLACLGWQSFLMDPLTARAHQAQQRLTETAQRMHALQQTSAEAIGDPLVAAADRNRALRAQQAALEAELHTLAQGYVAPERMANLLRELLARQQGLKLISLANLPVRSLSETPRVQTGNGVADPPAELAADDRGPFLHPVEIVVEGDYASVVAYLRALEQLPWRLHWQQLELSPGPESVNRVRLVIGALSLSRSWMSV